MEQNAQNKVLAQTYIPPYFREAWDLTPDTQLETEIICPTQLLVADRFDLACKLYYIDCVEKGRDLTYAKALYKAHLAAFTDGAFIEPGQKTKNSVSDYYAAFHTLITDIKENGFDASRSAIPVGENGAILDGAHRAAIAIYYKLPVTIVRIPGKYCCYDHNYFREKGMDPDDLDFMANQFIRYAEQVYTACLWPAAYDPRMLEKVDGVIRSIAQVAYKKEVQLSYHGLEQLMINFYKEQAWTGSVADGYRGVPAKAIGCYKKGAPTTIYLLTGAPLEQIVALKQKIRDLFQISNDSIHITDTHGEAVDGGMVLFNRNSIDYLNIGRPFENKAFVSDFIHRRDGLLEDENILSRIQDALTLYGINPTDAAASVSQATADLHNPKHYWHFWGVRLPSLDLLKLVFAKQEENIAKEILQQVKKLEQVARKYGRVRKEMGLTFRKWGSAIKKPFSQGKARIQRQTKVLYHKVKYRGQNNGSGKKDCLDLQAFFRNLNCTTCEYLVMRNWEGFYDDILLEGHNDIDVLCRDTDSRDIMVRLLDARPLTNDGFHYTFRYMGRDVILDTRILGDGYYDRRWQKDMFKTRKLHPLGFYIMDEENYCYSLMYHAIYQKKTGLSEEYAQRLNQMVNGDTWFDQTSFAQQLDSFMQSHHYSYTMTLDESVVKKFEITPIKKRVRYPLSIRLRHQAQRIREKHLLQRLKIKIRKFIKRG